MCSAAAMASLPLSAEDDAELDRLDALVAMRRDREALPDLETLADAHPTHGVIVFLYAKALRRAGERAKAGEVLARAERLAPGDPYVGLGLAWSARDAGDLGRAAWLSTPARDVRSLRGEALAIAAQEREAAGDDGAARVLFLESYQAQPMLDVLAACEQLSDVERDPRGLRAPWPIGVVERRWLFGALQLDLSERARARFGELPPRQVLPSGCDHTANLAAAWAERAGVDRLALFRALADRGGFCDCEICLNASSQDDEDVEVLLVAGRIDGGFTQGSVLSSFFVLEEIDPPELAASVARDRETTARDDAFAVDRGPEGLAIPPQLVTDGLLSDLVVEMTRAPDPRLVVTLVVIAPDLLDPAGRSASELAVIARGGVTTLPLARPLSDRLRHTLPWVDAALDELERALPPRERATSLGRWDLGDAKSAGSRLLARGTTGQVIDLASDAAPRSSVPATLVLTRDGALAAWLETRRTRSDLVVEDRVRGERRVVATDRLRSALVLDPEARTIFAATSEEIIAITIASGERRALAVGNEVAISSDGRTLAISDERVTSITLLDREGRALAPPFRGRAPVFSPRGDRLAYLARTEGTNYQAHVLELADRSHRRVGPPCDEACWTSFALDGRALVFQARTARRRTPLDGDRVRVDDDEVLVFVDLTKDDASRVLFATTGGTLRIASPIAHPSQPLVALRTRDAPNVGERLVTIAIDDAREQVRASEPLTPVRWLA